MQLPDAIPKLDYRDHLKEVFAQRKLKNPAYSLRCFARDIDLSPSMLSGVLNRKKNLATKNAVKIAKSLQLSHHELNLFLSSVDSKSVDVYESPLYGKSLTLGEEKFQYMSDPKYMALMALFDVKSFKSQIEWISERLGIFQYQSSKLIARLKNLSIIKEETAGNYALDHSHVFSSDGVSSQALRNFHRISLEHALHTIQTVPVGERDFYATLFAIDESDLKSLQAEVREFHRKIYLKYSQKASATRVYAIQNQIIPYSTRGAL